MHSWSDAGETKSVDSLQRRHQYQSAIAELSQLAISCADVDALLPTACSLMVSVLDLPRGNFERWLQKPVDDGPQDWGSLAESLVASRPFTAGEAEFVQSIAHVLRMLDDRQQRERRQLAEAEQRFQRIFQISPVALSMSTVEHGRIVDANERWLAIFGYRRDEVIGRTAAELGIAVAAEFRDELTQRVHATGALRQVEMTLRNKSGEILDIVASSVQLDTSPEETWIWSCDDITDRKRAEAERDQLLVGAQLARAEAEQALEKLDAVYSITDSLMADSDLDGLFAELLKRLRRTLQVDQASVLLLDEDDQSLYLRALDGIQPAETYPKIRVPLGAGVSGRIAAEGRPMIANDYSTIDVSGIEGPTPEALRETSKSVMGAPLRIRGKVAGVILATTLEPREFSTGELKLLALAADRAAPAIERGRLIAKIRSGLERQRMLSHRLLKAHEEERRRLAVELHDELGQVLTAVKINLESLERANDFPIAPNALTGMIGIVDEALQRVRDIALDLRPSVLDDLGLSAAMRWYSDRFARTGRIETHLSIGPLPALEPELRTACFRVAQEALTNVDRHAHAQHVWIDLHVLAGALELSIRDDGVGFDVAAARDRASHGDSVGLLGMQERVSLMGGEYEVVRVAAGGTEVRARFPIGEAAL